MGPRATRPGPRGLSRTAPAPRWGDLPPRWAPPLPRDRGPRPPAGAPRPPPLLPRSRRLHPPAAAGRLPDGPARPVPERLGWARLVPARPGPAPRAWERGGRQHASGGGPAVQRGWARSGAERSAAQPRHGGGFSPGVRAGGGGARWLRCGSAAASRRPGTPGAAGGRRDGGKRGGTRVGPGSCYRRDTQPGLCSAVLGWHWDRWYHPRASSWGTLGSWEHPGTLHPWPRAMPGECWGTRTAPGYQGSPRTGAVLAGSALPHHTQGHQLPPARRAPHTTLYNLLIIIITTHVGYKRSGTIT